MPEEPARLVGRRQLACNAYVAVVADEITGGTELQISIAGAETEEAPGGFWYSVSSGSGNVSISNDWYNAMAEAIFPGWSPRSTAAMSICPLPAARWPLAAGRWPLVAGRWLLDPTIFAAAVKQQHWLLVLRHVGMAVDTNTRVRAWAERGPIWTVGPFGSPANMGSRGEATSCGLTARTSSGR
jgi:hypothetical protein